MGHDPKARSRGGKQNKGRSSYIAYYNGSKLIELDPIQGKATKPKFTIVRIPPSSKIVEGETPPLCSKRRYKEIKIAFNKGVDADLEIKRTNVGVALFHRGNELGEYIQGLVKIRKGDRNIAFLILPLKDIRDRTSILRGFRRVQADFYFALYHGEENTLTNSEILALSKLRSIENRVGVLVLSYKSHLALKTNNYKNIKYFKEADSWVGFDTRNLGGPESIFSSHLGEGIPIKFRDAYYELIQDIRTKDASQEI
jgi:hypothetical protein